MKDDAEGVMDALELPQEVLDRLVVKARTAVSGTKHDGGKPPYHLLPISPLKDIVGVLKFGADKYGERNWEKGIHWSRVYRAAIGHLMSWWEGEQKDRESGQNHLAHAACNVLFLLEYLQTCPDLDDRPVKADKSCI